MSRRLQDLEWQGTSPKWIAREKRALERGDAISTTLESAAAAAADIAIALLRANFNPHLAPSFVAMAALQAAAPSQLGFGAALSSSFHAALDCPPSSVRPHGPVLVRSRLRFVGTTRARRVVRVHSSDRSSVGGEPADAAAAAAARKTSSLYCQNCDGNGVVLCSQCKGEGLNTEDHFNGRFKVGQTCWLCRGKRQMLCGECNGAGFLGGFLNTQDE